MRCPLSDSGNQETKSLLPEYSSRTVPTTYLMHDDSMTGAHIPAGCTLLINPEIRPQTGMIVLGLLNGEPIVRRLARTGRHRILHAENSTYKPLPVTNETDFKICGVVTSALINLIDREI